MTKGDEPDRRDLAVQRLLGYEAGATRSELRRQWENDVAAIVKALSGTGHFESIAQAIRPLVVEYRRRKSLREAAKFGGTKQRIDALRKALVELARCLADVEVDEDACFLADYEQGSVLLKEHIDKARADSGYLEIPCDPPLTPIWVGHRAIDGEEWSYEMESGLFEYLFEDEAEALVEWMSDKARDDRLTVIRFALEWERRLANSDRAGLQISKGRRPKREVRPFIFGVASLLAEFDSGFVLSAAPGARFVALMQELFALAGEETSEETVRSRIRAVVEERARIDALVGKKYPSN